MKKNLTKVDKKKHPIEYLNFDKDNVKYFSYEYKKGEGEKIIVESKDGARGSKYKKESPAGITVEDTIIYEPSIPFDKYLLDEQILYLYTIEGKNQSDICHIIGIPQPTISRILQKYGFVRGKYKIDIT